MAAFFMAQCIFPSKNMQRTIYACNFLSFLLYMLELFTPYLFQDSYRRRTDQEHPSAKECSSMLKTFKRLVQCKRPEEINILSAKLESNQESSARQSDVLTATLRILPKLSKQFNFLSARYKAKQSAEYFLCVNIKMAVF